VISSDSFDFVLKNHDLIEETHSARFQGQPTAASILNTIVFNIKPFRNSSRHHSSSAL